MHRKDAIAWVVSVCSVSLRLSQAKTLAILVAAAMRVQRVSLANIGRQMVGSAKHQIKRCWRFCANERVESADAMRGVLKRVLKKRKQKLLSEMRQVTAIDRERVAGDVGCSIRCEEDDGARDLVWLAPAPE